MELLVQTGIFDRMPMRQEENMLAEKQELNHRVLPQAAPKGILFIRLTLRKKGFTGYMHV